jgi:hypothetical protein
VQELGDHKQTVHATGAGWGQAEELTTNWTGQRLSGGVSLRPSTA